MSLLDFEAKTITVNFAPCQLYRCIEVVLSDDCVVEALESFHLVLTTPSYYVNERINVNSGYGEIFIIDDDSECGTKRIATSSFISHVSLQVLLWGCSIHHTLFPRVWVHCTFVQLSSNAMHLLNFLSVSILLMTVQVEHIGVVLYRVCSMFNCWIFSLSHRSPFFCPFLPPLLFLFFFSFCPSFTHPLSISISTPLALSRFHSPFPLPICLSCSPFSLQTPLQILQLCQHY